MFSFVANPIQFQSGHPTFPTTDQRQDAGAAVGVNLPARARLTQRMATTAVRLDGVVFKRNAGFLRQWRSRCAWMARTYTLTHTHTDYLPTCFTLRPAQVTDDGFLRYWKKAGGRYECVCLCPCITPMSFTHGCCLSVCRTMTKEVDLVKVHPVPAKCTSTPAIWAF